MFKQRSESQHPPKHRKLSVMHVGKFYPPHVGGIESHLYTLCRELRHSMDVRVLVANDKRRDEEAILDGVIVSRLAIHFSIAGAPVCTSMAWKIRKAVADIVHVHLPNPAGVIALLASGYKGPVVATWHSDVVRQRRLAQIFGPIQRRLLKKSSAIIATSPNYIESSPDLSTFQDKCRVIPYGIDTRDFQHPSHEAVAAVREQFGPRILLAVGRLVYYKGFEFLIRAMKHLSATLLIVGDGPLRHSLEQEARHLGVASRVVFLGEMQPHEIAPYYHACQVFVLSSIARSEAFGIVQLEAMACGKPVVNTQIASGVPYVSVDGITGITVPPANPEALAAAVNRLLDDHHLRAQYGAAAQKRVETEFSQEVMVRRVKDVYAEVLGPASLAHQHSRFSSPHQLHEHHEA